MKEVLLSINLFLLSIFVFVSCSAINEVPSENKEPKRVIPSPKILLTEVRKVMDPDGVLKNIKTLECKLKEIDVDHDSEDRDTVEYTLKYKNDGIKKYYFRVEEVKSKYQKRQERIIEIIVVNKKPVAVSVNENMKEIQELSPKFINKLKERALDFKTKITLGLFKPQLSEKVSKNIYNINGHDCFKLTLELVSRFADGSDTLELFVDCDKYLIRKFITDYYTVTDIEYKKNDNVLVMYKYKFKKNLTEQKTCYFTLEKLIINKPINDYILNNENLEGQEI